MLQERTRAAFGEGGVVDFVVHFDDREVAADVFLYGVEESGVCFGVVEGLARSADDTDGFARDENADRPLRSVELLGNDTAEFGILLRVRAHERDLRIVLIETAVAKAFRHGVGRVKIHHVEATWRDDGGSAGFGGGFESMQTRAEETTDEFIGPFGGGDVENAVDHSCFDERFHGASTDSGGMKHQDFKTLRFEDLLCMLNAGGGVAEHAGDDDRLFTGGAFGRCCFDHAADGAGGAGEDFTRDSIDARDVDDAREHDNVFYTDVLGSVAAGERGDHELGKTNGKRAHGAGGDGGAAATAERNNTVNFALVKKPGENDGSALRHDLDRLAAVLASDELRQIHAGGSGDFLAGNIGSELWRFECADIDDEGFVAALANDPGDECMFFAFSVHRSENCDSGHDHRF